jgi:hypothetical protein
VEIRAFGLASRTSVEIKSPSTSDESKPENETSDKKDKSTVTSLINKNKLVNKEKGKSKISIEAGEGEVNADNNEGSKNRENIAVIESTANDSESMNIIADEKLPGQILTIKKDLVGDPVQKTGLVTTTGEKEKGKTKVSQDEKKLAWYVDLAVSPILPIERYDKSTTFRRTLDTNNNLAVFSGKLVKTNIDASVAYSIALRKEISKRSSVGLGLQYLKLKEQITISGTETNTKYTVVDRLVNDMNGSHLVSDTVAIITEGQRQITAVNSYDFLSIPVFIQYNFLQKRSWSLGAVAGANINVYGEYKNEINSDKDTALIASSQTLERKNSIALALYGGFRVGKRITKKLELFGAPSLTWALGNQNIKNSFLNKKISQAGLNIGLSYKLIR